ncbi:MAG: ferritin [Limisphaerales bacterium]
MSNSKIAPAVLSELNRQINQELSAAYGYRALANWCDDQNLAGFTRWFSKQVGEEHIHAQKLIDFVIDRGTLPDLSSISAPKTTFKSLLEVARHVQAMEEKNTAGINAVYEAAIHAKDYPTQMLMQWYISEQVEEETWTLEMLERVEAASCAGGMSDLDRHIERYLEADKADGKGE